MADIDKTLAQMKAAPTGVRFLDLRRVCEHFFGPARQSGTSHAVFKTPWPGDPRARLRDQLARLAERGFGARMAFEAELILLERRADGDLHPADHGRMFTIDEVEARWDWSSRGLEAREAAGIAGHQFARERSSWCSGGRSAVSRAAAGRPGAADRAGSARAGDCG